MTVETLTAADAPAVIDALGEAFRDYPVMRYVLGCSGSGYDVRLETLVRFFVMARVLRGEVLLGVGDRRDLDAAALVSRPHGPDGPAELAALRERVWSELGPDEHARYDAFGRACARFPVEAPHVHLNMIGVRDRARGRGAARALLEHVHRLSADDPVSTGVSLTTEDPGNVGLYRHFGYEVIGEARVAPELRTWSFFRAD